VWCIAIDFAGRFFLLFVGWASSKRQLAILDFPLNALSGISHGLNGTLRTSGFCG